MTPPMMGTWRATVVDVRPFAIHGDPYYDLQIAREGGETTVRVPAHACPTLPTAGQTVDIKFLMGQVIGVKLG